MAKHLILLVFVKTPSLRKVRFIIQESILSFYLFEKYYSNKINFILLLTCDSSITKYVLIRFILSLWHASEFWEIIYYYLYC